MAADRASPNVQSAPQLSKALSSGRTKSDSWVLSLIRLVVAVSIVLRLHWTGPILVPRCQLVMYPTSEHGDVTYGLRVVLGSSGDQPWQLELGKIADDGLRSRMQSSYAGLADNWFYFKIESPEQSHLLLASLWKAEMITRQDAEAVLGKGPAKATSAAPFIHRLPSLSTLAAAYYAGATIGTRIILGRLTIDSRVAAVVVGAVTVGGASVLFSRSSLGANETDDGRNVTSSFSLGGLASKSPVLDLSGAGDAVPLAHVRLLSPQDAVYTSALSSVGADGQRMNLAQDWFDQAVAALESSQRQ
ncbi:hypothetical protein OIV83_004862 [Microbotryomycetes sp. JL201]|nr:hypothetical protein OIV83_004862 [Microbotryomycetes sp. JL201]